MLKQIHFYLIALYDYLRNKTETIKKGFGLAGIKEAINAENEAEDPFEELDHVQ